MWKILASATRSGPSLKELSALAAGLRAKRNKASGTGNSPQITAQGLHRDMSKDQVNIFR